MEPALRLCLFKDERREAPGLLHALLFSSGKPGAPEVCYLSLLDHIKAHSGQALANLWAGQASVTLERVYTAATWEIFLLLAKSFI